MKSIQNKTPLLLLILIGLVMGISKNDAFGVTILSNNQRSPFPPPGTESWINVRLPLKVAYHSTADSQHKRIISRKYNIQNYSNYPVSVTLSEFTETDNNDLLDKLNITMNDKTVPLIIGGNPNQDKDIKLGIIKGSYSEIISTKFFVSGETNENINIRQSTTLSNLLNFTLTALNQDGTYPKDKASIDVHNSEIEWGSKWNPKDNFDGGTNDVGDSLRFDDVSIEGDSVDTQKPGTYALTYSYRNVKKTVVVTVKVKPDNSKISLLVYQSVYLPLNSVWNPKKYYSGGTDEYGEPLPFEKLNIYSDSGGEGVDTSVPGVSHILYSYKGVAKWLRVTVGSNDNSSHETNPPNSGGSYVVAIDVFDSKIRYGKIWAPQDNFLGGINEFGQPLSINKVIIGGDKVDIWTLGTYNVTYSYKNVTKTAKVTVGS